MEEVGGRPQYQPPTVSDLGTITELTASHTVVMASQAARFAVGFAASLAGQGGLPPPAGGGNLPAGGTVDIPTTPSSPGPGPDMIGGGTPGGSTHGTITSTSDALPSGGDVSGGGAEGTGASRAADTGSGSSGSLPFTGLALMAVAGIGITLTSAGAAIRRLTRRAPRGDD